MYEINECSLFFCYQFHRIYYLHFILWVSLGFRKSLASVIMTHQNYDINKKIMVQRLYYTSNFFFLIELYQ